MANSHEFVGKVNQTTSVNDAPDPRTLSRTLALEQLPRKCSMQVRREVHHYQKRK